MSHGRVSAELTPYATSTDRAGQPPVSRGAGVVLSGTASLTNASASGRAGLTRSRREVEAVIAKTGPNPPDWWNSVQVKYPPSLNLTWAEPGKQWDAQKNLGQYIWDVINPNPARWREGVRLLHHVLTLNKDDPQKVEKTVNALARMYQNLLQDWARAAFWWRKAAQIGGQSEASFAFELGECYWKLGNRDMCVDLISGLDEDYTRNGSLIKLWADLGELDKALKLAKEKAEFDLEDPAYLAAAESEASGVFNVCTGKKTDFNEIIAALNDTPWLRLKTEYFKNPYPFYQNETLGDPGEALRALKFRAKYSVPEGIRDYFGATVGV